MKVSCSEFSDYGKMPKRYTGYGEDVSPALDLEEIPQKTLSLAIILDDLDVPLVKNYCHWVIWNIPVTNHIPEGIPEGSSIIQPFSAIQGKAWGKHVYRGPKPPVFSKDPHRYRFAVYAIDTMLVLSADAGRSALLKAMEGHILAQAELFGSFDAQ